MVEHQGIRGRWCGLVVVTLLVWGPTVAWATEAPCVIPHCLGEIDAVSGVKQSFTSADGTLVIDVVATTFTDVVLLQVVREGKAEDLRPAFVIAKPATVELVPLGGDLARPLVVLKGGAWARATSGTFAPALAIVPAVKRAKRLSPRTLLATYRQQQRAQVAAGQRTTADETLAKDAEELNAACKSNIEVRHDWSRLADKHLDDLTSPEHVCQDSFHQYVLQRCADDPGRARIRARLKAITCRLKPSGALGIQLGKDGTLLINASIGANRERQGSTAQRYLEKNLK